MVLNFNVIGFNQSRTYPTYSTNVIFKTLNLVSHTRGKLLLDNNSLTCCPRIIHSVRKNSGLELKLLARVVDEKCRQINLSNQIDVIQMESSRNSFKLKGEDPIKRLLKKEVVV